MNYPTETEHETMGQRQQTEDHWKVIFARFLFFIYFIIIIIYLFFAVILSTCKHALRKESTIKRSVDDLEIFDDQRQDHLIFVIIVEWI